VGVTVHHGCGDRDLQGIALLSVEGDFSPCEIQQNLIEFVAIKASSHGPFEEARAIDANSVAVTHWVGKPNVGVLDRIKSGVLVNADFHGEPISKATAVLLGKALASKVCRLSTLKMGGCTCSENHRDAMKNAWRSIARGLAVNASVVEIR
jgi:hypothetical protein